MRWGVIYKLMRFCCLLKIKWTKSEDVSVFGGVYQGCEAGAGTFCPDPEPKPTKSLALAPTKMNN